MNPLLRTTLQSQIDQKQASIIKLQSGIDSRRAEIADLIGDQNAYREQVIELQSLIAEEEGPLAPTPTEEPST